MSFHERITICLCLICVSIFLGCGFQHNTKDVSKSNANSFAQTDTSKVEKKNIVAKLKENGHLSIEKQVSLYRRLKEIYPDSYNFENEDQLTMYGYGFLWDDKPLKALEIFKLIADQFPKSSNAYDSLGEVYLYLGKEEESLMNYKKSLAMNPDNYNAEDFIEKILYPDKKIATPSALFSKVYPVQSYLEDLDDLAEKLIKTHPGIFKFTSEKEFLRTIEEKKRLITEQTTYGTFRWHCSEIIANVNCSHTGMGGFYPENEMIPTSLRFPLQTALIDESLHVIDPLSNQHLVSQKDEIISINDIPVGILVSDIYKHIPSQGLIQTTKRLFFNQWSTGLIAYALGFPKEYLIEVKGKKEPIVLLASEIHNDPVFNSPIKGCEEPLCLEFIDSETAILSIYSFNFYRWDIYDRFVDFIDKSFLEIDEKRIKNLVIDVRQNGGGAPEASIYLLQYLFDKPFTYFPNRAPVDGGGIRLPQKRAFRGNKYFLIDGRGNSTTGHFMAMVKDHELGTIIGEELGSNQFCTAGQTIFKLKNTRLEFYSATNQNRVSVTSLPDERGILPDHKVKQKIDEFINEKDVVREYTLNLIRGKL